MEAEEGKELHLQTSGAGTQKLCSTVRRHPAVPNTSLIEIKAASSPQAIMSNECLTTYSRDYSLASSDKSKSLNWWKDAVPAHCAVYGVLIGWNLRAISHLGARATTIIGYIRKNPATPPGT